jgi:1-acyl-sn-glycerol-3-phosphate acyltransferase
VEQWKAQTIRNKIDTDQNLLGLIRNMLTLDNRIKELRREIYFVWVMFFLLLIFFVFFTYFTNSKHNEERLNESAPTSINRTSNEKR